MRCRYEGWIVSIFHRSRTRLPRRNKNVGLTLGTVLQGAGWHVNTLSQVQRFQQLESACQSNEVLPIDGCSCQIHMQKAGKCTTIWDPHRRAVKCPSIVQLQGSQVTQFYEIDVGSKSQPSVRKKYTIHRLVEHDWFTLEVDKNRRSCDSLAI